MMRRRWWRTIRGVMMMRGVWRYAPTGPGKPRPYYSPSELLSAGVPA